MGRYLGNEFKWREREWKRKVECQLNNINGQVPGKYIEGVWLKKDVEVEGVGSPE